MFAFLIILHLIIAAGLVISILLQAGKGGGLAGAFGGGGGSQTIFGGRGAATFLGKSTWALGALFMISALTLALVSTRAPAKARRSVIEDVIRREQGQQTTSEGQAGPISGGQSQQSPLQPTQPAGQERGVAPGAGVVPSEVLPPEKGAATGETEKESPTGP